MQNETEVVEAIADGIIELADGDFKRAMVLAAAYLPNRQPIEFGNPKHRFGASDYAEDWS